MALIEAFHDRPPRRRHRGGANLLDPGFDLTLRPMRYPAFYEMFRNAIRNTWTVEEVDFSDDLVDLDRKLLPAERHLINRLVAFFATGDSIVANNLVLNLYKHINAPEARLYLSPPALRRGAARPVLPDAARHLHPRSRASGPQAFAAVENIPSIRARPTSASSGSTRSTISTSSTATVADRKPFLLNLICFAACIEGLFFFGAFAYVYFLRSRGLLNGLAAGTNWVFRDESMHMAFAFDVVETARREEPGLFDAELEAGPADARRGGRLRNSVRGGPARPGHRRHVGHRHADLPRTRRRPAARAPRDRPAVWQPEPVRVHGAARRAGADQLLRAARVGAYQVAVGGSFSLDDDF